MLLRQAVAIRPDDAAAQGLLALALVAGTDRVNRGSSAPAMDAAQQAADHSLRANPADPNARLAYMQLQRASLNILETEDRLRAILKSAPKNLCATQDLWELLQTTGQSRQALALVERSIALRPLAAMNNYPLAQLLWINGRVPEADRVIERAMMTWPTHQYVRFARFTILAFTERTTLAREMLQNPKTRPQIYEPVALSLWQTSLAALETPSPANIARVRQAYRIAVTEQPRLANQAVMVLSALGDVDAAYEIANKLLLFRAGAPGQPSRSTAWRFTPWLFTPPVAAMRADPRFVTLCDGIGLTDYWEKRGVRPDYKIGHR
jgi:tetratricopeptide (TPR) repeat protein